MLIPGVIMVTHENVCKHKERLLYIGYVLGRMSFNQEMKRQTKRITLIIISWYKHLSIHVFMYMREISVIFLKALALCK